MTARCLAVCLRQLIIATRAASMARAVSTPVISGMDPMTSPLTGLVTSIVALVSAANQMPLI